MERVPSPELLSRLDLAQLVRIAPDVAAEVDNMARTVESNSGLGFHRSQALTLFQASALIKALLPVAKKEADRVAFANAANAGMQRNLRGSNEVRQEGSIEGSSTEAEDAKERLSSQSGKDAGDATE
jgi:hypothetical protein